MKKLKRAIRLDPEKCRSLNKFVKKHSIRV